MIIGRTSPASVRNWVVCRHPWHTVRAGGTSLVTRPNLTASRCFA
jgi:hypothetical protein